MEDEEGEFSQMKCQMEDCELIAIDKCQGGKNCLYKPCGKYICFRHRIDKNIGHIEDKVVRCVNCEPKYLIAKNKRWSLVVFFLLVSIISVVYYFCFTYP